MPKNTDRIHRENNEVWLTNEKQFHHEEKRRSGFLSRGRKHSRTQNTAAGRELGWDFQGLQTGGM